MAKRKDKRKSENLFAQIAQTAASGNFVADTAVSHDLTKMKKFRFQLLHQWLTAQHDPCRIADVGGGKGLLAYLLQQDGWDATVIDPVNQDLPTKYKDLSTNKQVKIEPTTRVPRITSNFEPEMAQQFDLLVAMHAHGCNIQLIHAAANYHCDLILLPCCVIDEPILPPPGIHWIKWLLSYVMAQGFTVTPFQLNFKGQNIGLYAHSTG